MTGRPKIKERLFLKIVGKDVIELTDVAKLFNNAFVSIGENNVETIPSSIKDVSYLIKIEWNIHNVSFLHQLHGSIQSFFYS